MRKQISRKRTMGKMIKSILLITTLISLYIIFCVGLDWFWTIGSSSNADKINQILINISYSYIAGLIFFCLVSYLPHRLKIEKFKPIIHSKIDDLYNQINACIQTFETVEINNVIESITFEELQEVINNNDMYNKSFYAISAGYQMNNFKFLSLTTKRVFVIINSLLEYKEYMTIEQILNIEKIKENSFFHLVGTYEETPAAKRNYSSQQFKNAVIDELFNIIRYIKSIRKLLPLTSGLARWWH